MVYGKVTYRNVAISPKILAYKSAFVLWLAEVDNSLLINISVNMWNMMRKYKFTCVDQILALQRKQFPADLHIGRQDHLLEWPA